MPDLKNDPVDRIGQTSVDRASRRYWQVDVFADTPLAGNPLGVVFDSDGLDGATMQAIAQELNNSETVFFCPPTEPEADYKIRIFTPRHELAIAGHPSIGAAFAYISSSGDTPGPVALTQECGAGLIQIEGAETDIGTRLSVRLKPPEFRDSIGVDRRDIADMLGCRLENVLAPGPKVVSPGIAWLVAELDDCETIAGIQPDYHRVREVCDRNDAVGLTVFAPSETPGIRYRARSFAPGEGVAEDPACGSGNGSVAGYVWKYHEGLDADTSWISEQGIELGRGSRIYVEVSTSNGDVPQVTIGGHAVRVLSGLLEV